MDVPYFIIHLLPDGYFGSFQVWVIMNKAAVNACVQVLLRWKSSLLGKYQGVHCRIDNPCSSG